jgi:hypothetical protein
MLSFVRISRFNWLGHVIGTDSTRKVSQVFNIILRKVDKADDQKTDGGTVYKQILINAKVKTE